MLGIIFTGGEGPKAQVIQKLLGPELKDALIIAADSGLSAAENAGIKPDWIVGDMDSLKDQSLLDAFPSDRVIRHEREKDFSDTELAFSLAKEKGCDPVWIIGGGGGRIDHIFAIRSMFERDSFPHRWITANEDIYCISREQGTGIMEQKTEKGALVSVFPLGSGPWEAVSEGLKWSLCGLAWDRGFFGISNVAVDEKFSIIAETGRFMVILPLDNRRNHCQR